MHLFYKKIKLISKNKDFQNALHIYLENKILINFLIKFLEKQKLKRI